MEKPLGPSAAQTIAAGKEAAWRIQEPLLKLEYQAWKLANSLALSYHNDFVLDWLTLGPKGFEYAQEGLTTA